MNKWVTLGAGLLFLAWLPFLYAELTSSPQEKKERDIPDQHIEDEVLTAALDSAPEEEAEGEDEEDEEDEALAEDDEPLPAVAAAPGDGDELTAEGEDVADEGEVADEDEVAAEPPPPPPSVNGPIEVLKPAFDSETRDALWAEEVEARIASLLSADDIPESIFDRAACRKTVCRIDMQWSEQTAAPFLDAHEDVSQLFGGNLAMEPGAGTDEFVGVHVYVLREGYTLDDVAN